MTCVAELRLSVGGPSRCARLHHVGGCRVRQCDEFRDLNNRVGDPTIAPDSLKQRFERAIVENCKANYLLALPNARALQNVFAYICIHIYIYVLINISTQIVNNRL